MSKRESRRGGSSKTARVRGKEGDFFSSCKPFQLCSGLRTETGSERKREQSLGAHTSQREREREEKERRGTGIAWHFVSFSVREQEKEEGKEKSERGGRERVLGLSAGEEGEDTACKAKLGLELGGLSGSLPSGYSPTTHCSALHACLLAWLVQDPASAPFSVYPQMPSFTLASPPPRSCLLSIYCIASPLELWVI